MYLTESFDFWWLFPVFMILCCLFMRVSRRRRGMAGCCIGWGGSRDTPGGRPTDELDDSRRTTDTSTPAEEKSEAERLKRTFDRLEGRLRNLEDAVTSKEFDWNRRFDRS